MMNTTIRRAGVLLLGVTLVTLCSQAAEPAENGPATARVTESFSGDLSNWMIHPEGNWRIEDGVLLLAEKGPQRPPVRRPGAYVLLDDASWKDVSIQAKIKTLRPARIKGRDVCVLFGFQDDTHFYYAHLCSEANGKTHNVIVKVHGTKRTTITNPKRPEPRLTDGWHTVKVTHSTDGAIAVFMDDMETPLMTATDTDYPVGAVGVGSFDDVAQFDDVVVEGTLVTSPPNSE